MFKNQMNKNIERLDFEIGRFTDELMLEEDNAKREVIMEKLNKLIELRTKLEENRVKGSVKPMLISGAFSVASIALVLKYEEANVITSKAFGMATSMIRGSK